MTTTQELPGLRDAVQFVTASGMARWPALAVDSSSLTRHLAETPAALGGCSSSLAAERYLAFACAERAPQAIEIFQKLYSDAIDGGARSVNPSRDFIEDVRQRVLELLFIGSPGGAPRILQYKGQGPLGAWLRTTAKRLALRLATSDRVERQAPEEALANELAHACDQELALLRAHYSELFGEALVSALRELPGQERMLLQLSLVGGISTVRLAKMYQLNQSTISRQLQRAANKTFDNVRQRLRAELGIESEELESLLTIVRSHIQLTLSCFDDMSSTESTASPP
ncbi:MAG TPA: sigma-70 family RNA polymerase sigma factor [Polyangiaceae bacterium]|nr:sigma-70 family RNA polymerase sigma factor [Polyangiaceae bacterium]